MKYPLRVNYNCSLNDLSKWIGAEKKFSDHESVLGISLDSRTLQKGDVFFAVRGQKDGHDFVSDALTKGAQAAVVSLPMEGAKVIQVDDVGQALYQLTRHHRRQWGKPVVAISGSNGKTTTKEMVYALLSVFKKSHRSVGSWNNHLGIPLTVLGLAPDHDILVQEMGMNHLGEIKTYCQWVEPDVGVLTHIGPAHIEMLGSIENVAKAKAELFEGVKSTGVLVVNVDNPWIKKIADFCPQKKITVSLLKDADVRGFFVQGEINDHLKIVYQNKEQSLVLPKMGEHNVRNFLCAVGVLCGLGFSLDHLEEGLERLVMPEMRMEKNVLKHNLEVICDCYNANPDSMEVALSSFKKETRQKVFIVGDMKELGASSEQLHEVVGLKAVENEFSKIWALGVFSDAVIRGASKHNKKNLDLKSFSNIETLTTYALNNLKPNDLVLLKGSRSMQMERVLQFLQQHWGRS